MHAKSLQLCLTLRSPVDCNLSGSSVHGILQARILKWAAMPSSRGLFDLGMEPVFCIAGRFFPIQTTREAQGRGFW